MTEQITEAQRLQVWRSEAIDQGLHVNRLKGLLDRAVKLLQRKLPQKVPFSAMIIDGEIRELIAEANVWINEPGALATEEAKARWLSDKPESFAPKMGGTSLAEKIAKAINAHAQNQRIDSYVWELLSAESQAEAIQQAERIVAAFPELSQ